jgi:hypothetical protein
MSRKRQQEMRAIAIQRVLARETDRVVIGSLDDLRRAYENELAVHGTEIAAEADRFLTRVREIDRRILSQHRRCASCGGPMALQRISRRYCSDRCRQRAHRASGA